MLSHGCRHAACHTPIDSSELLLCRAMTSGRPREAFTQVSLPVPSYFHSTVGLQATAGAQRLGQGCFIEGALMSQQKGCCRPNCQRLKGFV